jgi:FkbM family methyltransferase
MGHLNRLIRTNPRLGRLAIKSIPNLRWSVDLQGIGAMTINLRRNRSYWLRDPLLHEAFMLNALGRLIRPGDTVHDAGANIGLYVRFMLQCFAAGRVVAYEPMSLNQTYLKRNIRRGGCEGLVQLVRAALTDYDGTAEFQVDDLSSASGTLDDVAGGAACQGRRQYGFPPLTESVAVSRLDTLVEQAVVPPPDLIKIDVEGAEVRLLHGAAQTLKRHAPKLVIELHGADAARGVVQTLLELDYAVFGYLGGGGGSPVYREITSSEVGAIVDQYSLHHCVAAPDRELLTAPIPLALQQGFGAVTSASHMVGH